MRRSGRFLGKAARLVLGLTLGWVSLQAAPPGKAPTRPSSGSGVKRTHPADVYVDLTVFGKKLGLKPQWTVPGKEFSLRSGESHFEFEVGSREMRANGVRVFLGQPVKAGPGSIQVAKIDAEDLLPALVRPGYGQTKIPGGRVVVIDPGHGGIDQGAENKRLRLQEKALTLDVSLRLKKLLEAQGYRVLMTRTTDRALKADKRADLQERAAVANRAKADLFISIHFNAVAGDTRTNGVEVYAFTPQYLRSTSSWGGRGNDTEWEASPVNAFDHWNFHLAHRLQRRMLSHLRADDRGQKMAHWGVLRQLRCPGVLVEAGFVTNEAEAKKIATPAYRQKIAESLSQGIKDYTESLETLRR